MPTEHRLARRVQFYETDAAGIVHFSWYPRYMEEAEHAMWRAAGLSIHLPDSEIGWPRVAISFEYFRPLRFEDEFEVHLRIADMTRKAIRYSCDLTRAGETVASGTMTIVCVQHRPNERPRAMEIPASVAMSFEAAPDGSPK